ncbi:hypothetical protein A130_14900 [Vibrio genomosp. F6 str. FF-238]|uniref:Carboxymuconolactone decarboxylase-like domain-containing protein n=2 Tax=Vibrio genomosp. F6 TaxID=723172 RepID=A0A1E5D0U6_9VIBR|nr:hypothetical protein A130_14900 [Vibrio genomosp. F6 str. FF-238]
MTRINLAEIQPTALTAMLGLEGYVSGTDLPAEFKEMIKLRASMINKCAYCIQMHTAQALELGMSQQQLFALAAWEESPLFNDTERAILALTDEMTRVADQGVSDSTYQAALAALGEDSLAKAMMQVITINAWNRFALATQMTH